MSVELRVEDGSHTPWTPGRLAGCCCCCCPARPHWHLTPAGGVGGGQAGNIWSAVDSAEDPGPVISLGRIPTWPALSSPPPPRRPQLMRLHTSDSQAVSWWMVCSGVPPSAFHRTLALMVPKAWTTCYQGFIPLLVNLSRHC